MDPWLIVLLLVVIVGVAAYLITRKGPQLPVGDEPTESVPAGLESPVDALPSVVSDEPAAIPLVVKAAPTEVSVASPLSEASASMTATSAETAPALVSEAAPEPAVGVTLVLGRAAPAPLAAPRDLGAIKRGLAQTRGGFMQRLFAVFSGKKEIDAALLEDIEETLLTGDVGAATTKRLVDALRDRLDRNDLADSERVWEALREDSRRILSVDSPGFGSAAKQSPLVILMVGVNGAGKTTTTAKLAGRYKQAGQKVLLAAADTFRAAAVQQLEMWGQRVGVTVHKAKDGAKPSAVVYEAVARGVAEGFDVVIADTAGRLQNKAPLMEELRKTRDAAGKACPGAPHEVLLVLDAVTGQNALSQAKEFREALDVTGVVLTKLDGTAKGGVILAVVDEFKLPVRFIGVGEKADDLRDFDTAEFIEALFSRGDGGGA